MLCSCVEETASRRAKNASYSEFMAKVDANQVKEVTLYLAQTHTTFRASNTVPQDQKFRTTIAKKMRRRFRSIARQEREISVKEVHNASKPSAHLFAIVVRL